LDLLDLRRWVERSAKASEEAREAQHALQRTQRPMINMEIVRARLEHMDWSSHRGGGPSFRQDGMVDPVPERVQTIDGE
jgi:hypothetical protein